MILNTGSGCPLDCTYCVLQAYLNNPFITLYVNWQDMLRELEQSAALREGSVVRIGTGEYGDSMVLEHLTGFAAWILPFLRTRPGLVLELKTKTTRIDPLLGLEHGGSIVVSWSLNAQAIAASEEAAAASIAERIAAARRVIDKGYRVGFHFDPVIFYPGWEAGYQRTITLLAEQIPGLAIAWISIGFLRYMPGLKSVAQQRFPETRIFAEEFIPGLDNKMRYPQVLRQEMGARLVDWLRQALGDVCIYLCMENAPVWRSCLGMAPTSRAELKCMLDRQARGREG
jgi:spore photoproduct lyase